jgi:type IX secretion system PorP/SprF family membrane protein
LNGQDAHFSQFYANPLYLNPAFAGTVNCPRFSINFRDQWPAIPKNHLTFSASYDQQVNLLHGGVGVLVSADIAGGGFLQTYNAGVIYNCRVRVSNQFNLQLALQGNFLNTTLNWQKFQFATDLIPPYTQEELPTDYYSASKSQLDVSVGMLGYTPYLYFGLAVHHLLPVQVSFFTLPKYKIGTRWTAHIGGKITLHQKMKDVDNYGDIFFYPNVIFISQKTFHYLHEGFYFKFYPFTIGAWLRHNFKNMDAVIVSCGVEYKFFRIGYSYDFNISKLDHTGGAHEVSLQFVIPCKYEDNQNTKQRNFSKYSPVACPKF